MRFGEGYRLLFWVGIYSYNVDNYSIAHTAIVHSQRADMLAAVTVATIYNYK